MDLKFPEKHQPAMAAPVDILHNLHGVIHFMPAEKKFNVVTRIFTQEKKNLKLAMGHQCLKGCIGIGNPKISATVIQQTESIGRRFTTKWNTCLNQVLDIFKNVLQSNLAMVLRGNILK